MNISLNRHLSRRTFLRGAGITLRAAVSRCDAARVWRCRRGGEAAPHGLHPDEHGNHAGVFFPEKAGADYAVTPYLERLAAHRGQLTVLSGVRHPGVAGGHVAEKCFITGTPHPDRGGIRNGVSLDQFAAEQIGNQTRYPSLVLAMSNEGGTLSYTRSGAPMNGVDPRISRWFGAGRHLGRRGPRGRSSGGFIPRFLQGLLPLFKLLRHGRSRRPGGRCLQGGSPDSPCPSRDAPRSSRTAPPSARAINEPAELSAGCPSAARAKPPHPRGSSSPGESSRT